MHYFVPYDGSPHSVAALDRAREYSEYTGADVTVFTVIPTDNAEYAQERGWLDEFDPFDGEQIVEGLRAEVHEQCPGATFEYETVHEYAKTGTIASRIRSRIENLDVDLVFLGSEDAGRVVSNISSVGQSVSSRGEYDIYLVQSIPED